MAAPPGTRDDLISAIALGVGTPMRDWMNPASPSFPQAPELLAAFAKDASRLETLQRSLFEQQARLWTAMLARGGRGTIEPVASPEPGDRRFAASEWRDNPYFDYLKQSYLLTSRYLTQLVDGAPMESQARERARFVVRQWIDAMCPANFAITNPEVMRKAQETQGESLAKGLANLISDSRKGRISQSDESAFEVGRNIAVTPGAVVYENELMQLIQYAPATATIGRLPLVMVPPCINKYYILDLQPENSFVRYAVSEGHTVFMVSWRNVGPREGRCTWDDYLQKGIFEAFDAAREISGADRVNALGFCVGGTLLGAALAVLAARREDIVESVTYLTTMLDFSETGQIGLFVDEKSLAAREASIGQDGVLPGADLANMFSSLRANDLIWPYVRNSYLKGEAPAAFDLLYWNADSTNLPGPMYCYYVRNTYLENRLRSSGALTNCGVAVDLGAVDRPSFLLATREDHIVPWRSAYRSTGLLGGEKTFVLGASGHVAGVINPAGRNRRSYWVADGYPADPEAWLSNASEHSGSWWRNWAKWLSAYKGGERAAPAAPGSGRFAAIEPAPGRYVRTRAESAFRPHSTVARAA